MTETELVFVPKINIHQINSGKWVVSEQQFMDYNDRRVLARPDGGWFWVYDPAWTDYGFASREEAELALASALLLEAAGVREET